MHARQQQEPGVRGGGEEGMRWAWCERCQMHYVKGGGEKGRSRGLRESHHEGFRVEGIGWYGRK